MKLIKLTRRHVMMAITEEEKIWVVNPRYIVDIIPNMGREIGASVVLQGRDAVHVEQSLGEILKMVNGE